MVDVVEVCCGGDDGGTKRKKARPKARQRPAPSVDQTDHRRREASTTRDEAKQSTALPPSSACWYDRNASSWFLCFLCVPTI